MQIDLSELSKLPSGSVIETDIKIEPKKFDKEVEIKKPLLGKVKIGRLDDGLLASFSVKTDLHLLCYRCVANFNKKIKLNFDQKYIFTQAKKTVIMNKASEEDFFICSDGKLDPYPAIRQEILLSLPIKILCKESCKGLCQNCGQNLNQKNCKCKKKAKLKIQSSE